MKTAIVTGATGGIGVVVSQALAIHYEVVGFRHSILSGQTGDILVCCHAAPAVSSFAEVMEIDVKDTLWQCQELAAHMATKSWGRIVLFSSIRAHAPRIGQIAYATAKGAIEGMTRALAVEYGRYGITVNCIAPGAVLTSRTRANIAAGVVSEAELVGRTPAGRLCTPEDIAACVLWLISDGAAMVSGQVLTVDGGWSVSG